MSSWAWLRDPVRSHPTVGQVWRPTAGVLRPTKLGIVQPEGSPRLERGLRAETHLLRGAPVTPPGPLGGPLPLLPSHAQSL